MLRAKVLAHLPLPEESATIKTFSNSKYWEVTQVM